MPELNFQPAIKHPELVSPTISSLLEQWHGSTPAHEVLVAEIDPAFAKGEDLSSHYGVPLTQGANCVIVEAVRGEHKTYAACLAPVGSKIDFNSTVRKHLDARRVSLAPLDFVLAETKMEYGSITAVGLPATWKILIDAAIMQLPRVIIGAGLVKSKLSVPASFLTELPNTAIIENLSAPVNSH